MRTFTLGELLCGLCAANLLLGCGGPPPQPKIATRAFVRLAFQFEYPATWSVDETDEDYDPDRMFSVDASPSAMVMFVVFDEEQELAAVLAANVHSQEQYAPSFARAEFKTWGRFAGVGETLKSRSQGARFTTRIFAFHAGGKTFVVTEHMADGEQQRLTPGFRTVAGSFQSKGE